MIEGRLMAYDSYKEVLFFKSTYVPPLCNAHTYSTHAIPSLLKSLISLLPSVHPKGYSIVFLNTN